MWVPVIDIYNLPINSPVHCILVNQTIFLALCFVAYLKGYQIAIWYKLMVFAIHFSCLIIIHHQKNMISFKTLKKKKAFAAYCDLCHHTNFCYNWDSGWFEENAFLLDVSAKRQRISFISKMAQQKKLLAIFKIMWESWSYMHVHGSLR